MELPAVVFRLGTGERWPAFERRVRATQDRRTRAILASVKKEAGPLAGRISPDEGRVRAPVHAPALDRHAGWLVAYQVLGESYTQIATDEPVLIEWQAVQSAVLGLAAEIDIPLRPPGRGGRPRKH